MQGFGFEYISLDCDLYCFGTQAEGKTSLYIKSALKGFL